MASAPASPNLRPDRRWQYQAAYEQDFWGKGALVASAMQEDISDLVDYRADRRRPGRPGQYRHAARNNEYKVHSVPATRRSLSLTGGLLKTTLQWDDSAP